MECMDKYWFGQVYWFLLSIIAFRAGIEFILISSVFSHPNIVAKSFLEYFNKYSSGNIVLCVDDIIRLNLVILFSSFNKLSSNVSHGSEFILIGFYHSNK